jgi:PTH1 family peptidyl-tRNA hydrolase
MVIDAMAAARGLVLREKAGIYETAETVMTPKTQATPRVVIPGAGIPGSAKSESVASGGAMSEIAMSVAAIPGVAIPVAAIPVAAVHGTMKGGLAAPEVVILVKPLTYMNLSGHAVVDVLRRRGLSCSDIIVVQDDVDIECGRLKIKRGGSSGGHKGVQSIIETVGIDFTRVKLGVGRDPDVPVERYVLGRFSGADADAIGEAIERACNAVECIITEGVEAAMNRFNAN